MSAIAKDMEGARTQEAQPRGRMAGVLGRPKLARHPEKTQVVDLGIGGIECKVVPGNEIERMALSRTCSSGGL
ncbi:MAG: hypothetical protein HYY11_03195 [Candidatus Methylomirabilis oxyfera]|nr:hypothetical protein [Candidatus Methylomirabilis oxyfera]